MKDPLHRDDTPYDVLGVGLDASDEQILRAAVPRPNADASALTGALAVLTDVNQRAEIDLFLYEDATLARIVDTADRAAALAPPAREKTAAAWRRLLADSPAGPPDLEIVRALAVLCFWSAVHAFREGRVDQRAWEGAFGCFALISRRTQQLGPRFARADAAQLAESIRNLIPQRLSELVTSTSDPSLQARLGAAQGKLETAWSAELSAAAELETLASQNGQTRFQGGALFLRDVGRLDDARRWLQTLPAGSRRDELIRRLSSNARVVEIAQLISGGAAGAEAALREIEALPAGERTTPEVVALEVEARARFGRDRLEAGDLQKGLSNLETAAKLAPHRPLPADALKKVEEVCLAEASAAQDAEPAARLKILERGHAIHRDSANLRVALGDALTADAKRVLDDVFARHNRGLLGREETANVFRGEIRRLDRAASLGSKRARDLLFSAQRALAQLEEAIGRPPRPDPLPERPVVARPEQPPPRSPPAPRVVVRQAPAGVTPPDPVLPPRAVAVPARRPIPVRSSWYHRSCAALALAWSGLGLLTLLAMVGRFDIELMGADLFAPLDPLWRRTGSAIGFILFAAAPLLLLLGGRRLTAGTGGRRFVEQAARPTRIAAALWLPIIGLLLIDQSVALVSDHFLPNGAYRALADRFGSLGLIGCFALGALLALPLLVRWAATPRRF